MKKSFVKASACAAKRGDYATAAAIRLAVMCAPSDEVQAPNGRTDERGDDGYKDFYGMMLKNYQTATVDDLTPEQKDKFYEEISRSWSKGMRKETAAIEVANYTLNLKIPPEDIQKAIQLLTRLGTRNYNEVVEQIAFILCGSMLKVGKENGLSDSQIFNTIVSNSAQLSRLLHSFSKSFQAMQDQRNANTDTSFSL